MDVAQGIQRPPLVRVGKPGAVIPLFPKMPSAVKHSVEAHGRKPVQPVHDFRQILRLLRLQQVVHMVAHDAQSIQLKAKPIATALDRHQQHLFAFKPGQAKVAVIASHSDVLAIVGFQFTRLAWHGSEDVDELLSFITSLASTVCKC